MLGDIFLSTGQFLRCYVEYVNNYNNSMETLSRLRCGSLSASFVFIATKAGK